MNKVFSDLDRTALKRLYLALQSMNNEETIQELKLKSLGIGLGKLESMVFDHA